MGRADAYTKTAFQISNVCSFLQDVGFLKDSIVNTFAQSFSTLPWYHRFLSKKTITVLHFLQKVYLTSCSFSETLAIIDDECIVASTDVVNDRTKTERRGA